MAVETTHAGEVKRFVMKRSELNTEKLFVEFYLPEYRERLERLRTGPYPIRLLRDLSVRMFDGPFGSNRKIDMYQDSGIPYIRVKDVLPEGINVQDLVYIPPEKHAELIRSRVVPGNVLITIAGRLGTAAVFPDAFKEGNITGHIVGIELPKGINPHYLTTFINSSHGGFQVTRLGQRTTRPELNLHEVGQILVPLPPRPVQDRIAQVMQEAYQVRQARLTHSEALQRNMDSWAFELLGLFFDTHRHSRSFVTSGSSVSGKRWDVNYHAPVNPTVDNGAWSQLKDYADVSRDICNLSHSHSAIDYVAVQGLSNNPYSSEENTRTITATDLKGLCQSCETGDILLARLGPCITNRKSVLVHQTNRPTYCSPEFLVIRPHSGTDSRFILWAVKATFFLEQMLAKMTGATPSRMRLHGDELLKMRIPIVSSTGQQQIGAEFEHRRVTAERLRAEAGQVVAEAKARVEQMIVGEEPVG